MVRENNKSQSWINTTLFVSDAVLRNFKSTNQKNMQRTKNSQYSKEEMRKAHTPK
jgi:hypothetical protein